MIRRGLARAVQVARLAWFRVSSPGVLRKWRAMEREDGFDAAHGTDTTRQRLRLNYGATPVRTFRAILAALPAPVDGWTFVDLGSGKGRALLMADEHPFARIVGVERNRGLHAVAGRNLEAYARRTGKPTDRIELRREDAVSYTRRSWPAIGDVLLFLYSPFPSAVLREVCDAIRGHGLRQRITVAFVNPSENMRRALRSLPGLASVARFEPEDPSLARYEAFEIFTTEPAP